VYINQVDWFNYLTLLQCKVSNHGISVIYYIVCLLLRSQKLVPIKPVYSGMPLVYSSGSQPFLKQAPLLSSKKSQAPTELLHVKSICFFSVTTLLTIMSVRRIFFQGRATRGFFQTISRGAKSGKISFFPTRN